VSLPGNRHVPLGIPNGWFAVAWSRDLAPGGVRRARYFGEELVVFRGESGRAWVLDAYCAHLGAHLAEGGRVVGDTVRCPFHGWQYDGDGRCSRIPYCARIPARARVRAWPTVERNRMVFAWHHAEGKPPDWEVPELPELSDPEWREPRPFELQVPCHMQEMAENNCDPVHFRFVHGNAEVPPSELSFGADGRFFRVSSTGTQETPHGEFETTLERDTWGLGVTSVRLKGLGAAGLLMFSSTSPVDEGQAHSRWLFTTRNVPEAAGAAWIASLEEGVMQDMRIWRNKIYRPHPVLCEADGHLAAFRRWARQFYSEAP
jgi:nitrite reductase/ring-hydroxylating ferredoxin subunit